MLHSETFSFPVGNQSIAATIDWNANKDKPTILFIHGSRPSNRNSAEPLAKTLSAAGYSCLRFDLSGHGESSGALSNSVHDYISDTMAALQYIDTSKPLIVIGSSMGGHIALELLAQTDVESLILFCPAAYPAEAVHASFEARSVWPLQECHEIPVFENLKKFKGRFMHIIGEHDTIIPANITQQFMNSSVNASRCEFKTLKNAPHALSKWLVEHPDQQKAIFDTITGFIA